MPKSRRKTNEERLERKLKEYKRKYKRCKRRRKSPSVNENNVEVDNFVEIIAAEEEVVPENIEPVEALEIIEVDEQLEEGVIEAMGPPINEETLYGRAVHPEIFKRVQNILIEGLNKERIDVFKKGQLIPENTTLLKAPALNPELKMIVESVKERDKKIEERQNLLGVATGTILTCLDDLSKKDFDKLNIIKNMTEAAKVLAHLHFENTDIRKRLLLPYMDKGISKTLMDLHRDKFLFSEKFTEHIKSTTALQKSAVSILKKPPQKQYKPPLRPTTTSRPENYQPPSRQGTQRKMFRGGRAQQYQRPVTKVQGPPRRQPPMSNNYQQHRARYP